ARGWAPRFRLPCQPLIFRGEVDKKITLVFFRLPTGNGANFLGALAVKAGYWEPVSQFASHFMLLKKWCHPGSSGILHTRDRENGSRREAKILAADIAVFARFLIAHTHRSKPIRC